MQSMFRLPWSTEPHGDKFCDKLSMPKPRHAPLVNGVGGGKRKRTDSVEASQPTIESALKKSKVASRGEVQTVAVNRAVPSIQPASGDKVSSATATDSTEKKLLPADLTKINTTSLGSVAGPSPQPPVVQKTPDAQPKNSADMATAPADETSYLTPLQQKIEAQFNLEILIKHEELRLIEQELAKAQIALEQLRRCQIIPFPGTTGLSENVSKGIGSALRPRAGFSQPPHAAAWGVTDGPYSKHYAKWLIPDPAFDSAHYSTLATAPEGRATRGHNHADRHVAPKARMSRNSHYGLGNHAVLTESGPAAPKGDPLVLTRHDNKQKVKLFCSEHPCNHSNFSNVQGFLNHMRIKHGISLKSHDEAACKYGLPISADGTVSMPTVAGPAVPMVDAPAPQVKVEASLPAVADDSTATGSATPALIDTPISATTPATPFVPMPPSAITTPVIANAPNHSLQSSSNGLVHPLISSNNGRSAPDLPRRRVPPPTPVQLPESKAGASSSNTLITPNGTPGGQGQSYFPQMPPLFTSSINRSSSIPSPVTPFLSKMILDQGKDINLKRAVSEATEKIDLTAVESHSDEDEMMTSPGQGPSSPAGSAAGVPHLRGGMAPAHRSLGKKGQPTALSLGATSSLGNSDSCDMPDSPVQLSPHTLDSNPGLVSDNDDEEDEDDNCSVSHLDQDGDAIMRHHGHPIFVEDGSDAECERRKGMEGFQKAGSSQKA